MGITGWPQLYGSLRYEETVGAARPTPARIDDLSYSISEGYFRELFGR